MGGFPKLGDSFLGSLYEGLQYLYWASPIMGKYHIKSAMSDK